MDSFLFDFSSDLWADFSLVNSLSNNLFPVCFSFISKTRLIISGRAGDGFFSFALLFFSIPTFQVSAFWLNSKLTTLPALFSSFSLLLTSLCVCFACFACLDLCGLNFLHPCFLFSSPVQPVNQTPHKSISTDLWSQNHFLSNHFRLYALFQKAVFHLQLDHSGAIFGQALASPYQLFATVSVSYHIFFISCTGKFICLFFGSQS